MITNIAIGYSIIAVLVFLFWSVFHWNLLRATSADPRDRLMLAVFWLAIAGALWLPLLVFATFEFGTSILRRVFHGIYTFARSKRNG